MHIAMAGRSANDAVNVLLTMNKLYEKLTVDEYMRLADEHLDRLLPTAQVLPGAVELVTYLHEQKVLLMRFAV